jgi:hypothetical protein
MYLKKCKKLTFYPVTSINIQKKIAILFTTIDVHSNSL